LEFAPPRRRLAALLRTRAAARPNSEENAGLIECNHIQSIAIRQEHAVSPKHGVYESGGGQIARKRKKMRNAIEQSEGGGADWNA
jgi:hypothetical protein